MLMFESLWNDGWVWVLKKLEDVKVIWEGKKIGLDIVEEDRDYYLECWYFVFGNLVLCDVVFRVVKVVCDEGLGVSFIGLVVFFDFVVVV